MLKKFSFQSIGPLGQCFLYVKMSVCVCVCLLDCFSSKSWEIKFTVQYRGLPLDLP